MDESIAHVYIDTCCLNRPLDDASHERVRLEAESVRIILGLVESGRLYWTTSDIVAFEIDQSPFPDRREMVESYLRLANQWVEFNSAIVEEAIVLEALGTQPMDALHLASARVVGVDFFLTVDDALLHKAKIIHNKAGIQVRNPLEWVGDFK